MDDQQRQTHVETRLLEAPTVRDYLDDFALRAGRHLGSRIEVSISLRHAGQDRLVASSSCTYSTSAGLASTAAHA